MQWLSNRYETSKATILDFFAISENGRSVVHTNASGCIIHSEDTFGTWNVRLPASAVVWYDNTTLVLVGWKGIYVIDLKTQSTHCISELRTDKVTVAGSMLIAGTIHMNMYIWENVCFTSIDGKVPMLDEYPIKMDFKKSWSNNIMKERVWLERPNLIMGNLRMIGTSSEKPLLMVSSTLTTHETTSYEERQKRERDCMGIHYFTVITLLDPQTMEMVRQVTHQHGAPGGSAGSTAVSSCGSWYAVGNWLRDSTIHIHNTHDYLAKTRYLHMPEKFDVCNLCFTPCGEYLVGSDHRSFNTGARSKFVVWSLKTEQIVWIKENEYFTYVQPGLGDAQFVTCQSYGNCECDGGVDGGVDRTSITHWSLDI